MKVNKLNGVDVGIISKINLVERTEINKINQIDLDRFSFELNMLTTENYNYEYRVNFHSKDYYTIASKEIVGTETEPAIRISRNVVNETLTITPYASNWNYDNPIAQPHVLISAAEYSSVFKFLFVKNNSYSILNPSSYQYQIIVMSFDNVVRHVHRFNLASSLYIQVEKNLTNKLMPLGNNRVLIPLTDGTAIETNILSFSSSGPKTTSSTTYNSANIIPISSLSGLNSSWSTKFVNLLMEELDGVPHYFVLGQRTSAELIACVYINQLTGSMTITNLTYGWTGNALKDGRMICNSGFNELNNASYIWLGNSYQLIRKNLTGLVGVECNIFRNNVAITPNQYETLTMVSKYGCQFLVCHYRIENKYSIFVSENGIDFHWMWDSPVITTSNRAIYSFELDNLNPLIAVNNGFIKIMD